jgi:hypothetical protein
MTSGGPELRLRVRGGGSHRAAVSMEAKGISRSPT